MQPTEPGAPRANQYEFILNPEQAPKKSPLGGGNSMAIRALLVIGGLFVLIIIIAVVAKGLTGGSSDNKAALLSVAQDQTEIIRIATNASQNAVSQGTKNMIITTQLSVQSQNAALLNYLKSNGQKPSSKQLGLKQSSTDDAQLAAAQSSSTFDAALKTVMQKDLQAYQADLSAAYKTTGPKGQALLTADYNSATLLLQMNAGNGSN